MHLLRFSLAFLVFEGRDLLDGDSLACDGVRGGGHDAVGALAQKIEIVVAGTDLKQYDNEKLAVHLTNAFYEYI
jgi:hypothetical protein